MARKSLPYVNSYRDRTGKMRHYLRRPGQPRVSLSGKPGSRAFMQSYAEATGATPKTPPKPIRIRLRPRIGQVYFLSDGKHIKIGFTIDWEKRKKTYRTHSSRKLKLLAITPGFRPDETALHRRFKQYRLEGSEWFVPSPEIIDHIKKTVDEMETCREQEVTHTNLRGQPQNKKVKQNQVVNSTN